MSRGVLDEAAHLAAVRAEADAAKRGLRLTGMTAIDTAEGRAFRFQYEPRERQRKASPALAEAPPIVAGRGVKREAGQGLLL